jgi:hypothetical protein
LNGGEVEAHWPMLFAAGAYLKRDGFVYKYLEYNLRMQNSSSETGLTSYYLLQHSGCEIAVEVETY